MVRPSVFNRFRPRSLRACRPAVFRTCRCRPDRRRLALLLQKPPRSKPCATACPRGVPGLAASRRPGSQPHRSVLFLSQVANTAGYFPRRVRRHEELFETAKTQPFEHRMRSSNGGYAAGRRAGTGRACSSRRGRRDRLAPEPHGLRHADSGHDDQRRRDQPAVPVSPT